MTPTDPQGAQGDGGLTTEALALRVLRLAKLALETREELARLTEAVIDVRRVLITQHEEIRRLYCATAGLAAKRNGD